MDELAARIESFLATEDAFADFQVSARVDEDRLVSSGRIAAAALSGL